MPPQFLEVEEDAAAHISGSKKRKADDASLDEGRRKNTPTTGQQTAHARSAVQDSARKTGKQHFNGERFYTEMSENLYVAAC